MIFNVTNTFTKLNATKGTIQNASATYTIEVSDKNEENSGIILNPQEKYSFSDTTIYVRCANSEQAKVRYSSLVVASCACGGGDGGGTSSDDGDETITPADIGGLFNP